MFSRPTFDSQIKGVEGDLKSDAPPFEKDAASLVDLAAAQPAPVALQGISAAQADLAYKWSATLLSDAIANAGQGELAALLANVGHVATMTDDYGTAQLPLLQGKDQEAAAQIKAAVVERDGLVDANARNLLPLLLPAGLAFPVQAAAPVTPRPVTPTPAPTDQGAAPAPPAATTPAPTPPADTTTPPTTPPATAPADGAATPAATAPATPPADGSTPPATPPATPPPAPTTPPAQ